MSENPYKAQFQANKATTPFNKPSTVPAFMAKNESSQPAGQGEQPASGFKPPGAPQWKPNQNTASTPNTTPFQPPGFKPPVSNQNNNSIPTPVQPSGGFKPPGMNQGAPPNTGFQPPGFKPPGTNPPGQQTGGFAGWKNKPSPLGTDRKKQQEEAAARLKKDQQQKKAKLKEQEVKRQQKQNKRMQFQDEYSKIRQQQDKSKKTTKGSKKILKSPDKKSPSKSYKKLPPLTTSFHRYLFNLGLACSKQQQYSRKIQNQKQYINSIYKFTEQLKQGLINYLKQRKISQRKKNVINLQNMVVEYALVQGISGQPGSAYFKTKSIQNLQLKYCCYQAIFHLVAKLIKKCSVFRIRAPLLARFSYKGIQFLGEGVCQQLLEAVPAPAQNFIELHGQLTQLQKELKEAGYQQLTRKSFLLKKITFNNQQTYILYISQPLEPSLISKQSNINRLYFHPYVIPTLDSLINLSLISSRKINLTYSFMRNFNQQFKNNTAQKMKQTYLSLFPLAHAIRIVYASCQGELDDQSFWYLVWDGNTQIWGMVRRAFQGIYGELKMQVQQNLKNKYMLAKIIQVMVPVTFGVGKQRINQKNESTSSKGIDNQPVKRRPKFIENNFLIYPYPLQSFQLFEISYFFDKTIQIPAKIKIAQDSHKLQESILQQSQQLYLNKITVFTNRSLLLFKKGLLTRNLQLIKQSIQSMENHSYPKGRQLEKIIIYPLLIKFYMEAIQANLQAREVEPKDGQIKQQKQQQQVNDINKSKDQQNLDESEVKQIHNSQQIKMQRVKQQKKQKSQVKKQKSNKLFKKQEDYETRILKIFQLLIGCIDELFEQEKQIWMHAGLYLILASYYSKPKPRPKQSLQTSTLKLEEENITSNQQAKQLTYFNQTTQSKPRILSKSQSNTSSIQLKEKFKNAQSAVQQLQPQNVDNPITRQHPYRKQILKFIELGHNICMQFYGAHSAHMAQFMLHESDIYYNIRQYKKAQASITESLKIYKSSSKHARQLLTCSITLGKSLLQMGKEQQNSKIIQRGVEILQKIVEDLVNLGMDTEAMSVYEFLCVQFQIGNNRRTVVKGGKVESPTQFDGNMRYAKVEQYLQKMAQMAFLSKNLQSLKKVIRKVVKNELPFYSKEVSISLKDAYDKYIKQNKVEDEDEHEKLIRLQQSMTLLEEQKSNFGGVIEVIKWSFGILRSKIQSLQFEKANQILKYLLGFFNQRQIIQLLCL